MQRNTTKKLMFCNFQLLIEALSDPDIKLFGLKGTSKSFLFFWSGHLWERGRLQGTD